MSKKWCIYDEDLNEVFLREHRGFGYSYQYARSLAVQAKKKYGGNYKVIEEPED